MHIKHLVAFGVAVIGAAEPPSYAVLISTSARHLW